MERHLALAALVLVSALGCSGTQKQPNEPDKPRVFISEELLAEDESAALSWMYYGVVWRKRLDEAPGPLTYEEEMKARGATAQAATYFRDEGKLTNPYLVDLVAVYEAGYLGEYVYHCVPYGDWPEPANLRTADFSAWMKSELPNHEVVTMVTMVTVEPGVYDVGVRDGRHPPTPCAPD